MDELVKMKKLADQRKLQIIPIFYKVSATDVRKQTGEFGENFWTLAKTSSGDQIRKWKEALECVSNKMVLPTQYSFFLDVSSSKCEGYL